MPVTTFHVADGGNRDAELTPGDRLLDCAWSDGLIPGLFVTNFATSRASAASSAICLLLQELHGQHYPEALTPEGALLTSERRPA